MRGLPGSRDAPYLAGMTTMTAGSALVTDPTGMPCVPAGGTNYLTTAARRLAPVPQPVVRSVPSRSMTLTRGTTLLLGTALGATLLTAAPGLRRIEPTGAAPPAPPRPGEAVAAVPGGPAIDWSRLAARPDVRPAPRPVRNPFDFARVEPEAPQPLRGGPPPVAASDELRLLAPRPALALIGIAEDATPMGVRRRAILRSANDVVLAAEGDEIAGRFVVVAIDADAVELRDRQGGALFRLTLR